MCADMKCFGAGAEAELRQVRERERAAAADTRAAEVNRPPPPSLPSFAQDEKVRRHCETLTGSGWLWGQLLRMEVAELRAALAVEQAKRTPAAEQQPRQAATGTAA